MSGIDQGGIARAAWTLVAIVLLVAYGAIAAYTGNPWPWHEIVHETGDKTLLGTILYVEHAAGELPLDLILGVAIGSSALFALPQAAPSADPDSTRTRDLFAISTFVLVAVILIATVWTTGIRSLVEHLFQMHTRPGEPLSWGAHWRYHLLSTGALMLVSLGAGGMLLLWTGGRSVRGNRAGLSAFALTLVFFVGLTMVFAPDRDSFTDPVFLGHQVREVLTHLLVSVPAGWGTCLLLARTVRAAPRAGTASIMGPLVAGAAGAAIALFLVFSGLRASAASLGQTQSLMLLIFPHFFEHTLSYAVVALAAGTSYQWLRTRASSRWPRA